MRVLHICSGNLYGGVETLQVTLARHRGLCPAMEPEYAVCFEGRLAEELGASGVSVHRLGSVRVRNPIAVWRARANLREALAKTRYDVAVCHSAWSQAIFGPVVRETGVPLVFWLHGDTTGKHWLERWARKTRPDSVNCCSEFVGETLPKLYPGVRKHVVYYPVQPVNKGSAESRLATRRELNTPEDAVVIIQVSRIERWKGQAFHLEALGELKGLQNWVCWFVGGAQRPEEKKHFAELKTIAAERGIADRIRFIGQRSDVAGLLDAADVFCQPNSGPEPFGIVFVEALWSGLPVVTTAMGGGQEIVDSTCGILTPPGDAQALAMALQTLATDAVMRSRMGRAGPVRARELCALDRQIPRLARVFEEAIAHRGSAQVAGHRRTTPGGWGFRPVQAGADVRIGGAGAGGAMRVLQICSGNLYGGVEAIQVTLARHRGLCPSIEPEYAVCFEGRFAEELDASGARVHRLGSKVRVRFPISLRRARAKLREVLARNRYDVAVCHSAWSQAIFGPVVREAGVTLVFWMHGEASGTHWLERWARRTRPDSVICCSEFVAESLAKLYPGVPNQVVYNPVQPFNRGSEAARLATRRELNTPADALVIIQVSRMERWKGHAFHLAALSALKSLPNWVCWFVGGAQRSEEKKYFAELKALAAERGIADRVRFLGQRPDVNGLLNAADVFCQPNSGPEPFGNVFVEALWTGLPVISTAIGGGLEIVDSTCGILVPPQDARALAEALKTLAWDAGMRARMGSAGPERARELCALDRQMARLASAYGEAMGCRRVA